MHHKIAEKNDEILRLSSLAKKAEQRDSDLAFLKTLLAAHLGLDRQLMQNLSEQGRILLEQQLILRLKKDHETSEKGVQACIYDHEGFLLKIQGLGSVEKDVKQLILENQALRHRLQSAKYGTLGQLQPSEPPKEFLSKEERQRRANQFVEKLGETLFSLCRVGNYRENLKAIAETLFSSQNVLELLEQKSFAKSLFTIFDKNLKIWGDPSLQATTTAKKKRVQSRKISRDSSMSKSRPTRDHSQLSQENLNPSRTARFNFDFNIAEKSSDQDWIQIAYLQAKQLEGRIFAQDDVLKERENLANRLDRTPNEALRKKRQPL